MLRPESAQMGYPRVKIRRRVPGRGARRGEGAEPAPVVRHRVRGRGVPRGEPDNGDPGGRHVRACSRSTSVVGRALAWASCAARSLRGVHAGGVPDRLRRPDAARSRGGTDGGNAGGVGRSVDRPGLCLVSVRKPTTAGWFHFRQNGRPPRSPRPGKCEMISTGQDAP